MKKKLSEQTRQVVNICFPAGTDIESLAVQQYINRIITEVYRHEAKHYLPGRMAELAQKHGFRYSQVSIRNNKTNWGSCSRQNNISLNLNLMKLPNYLIDYIILHELAHTIVKNHSADFYRVLNSVTDGKARALAKRGKKLLDIYLLNELGKPDIDKTAGVGT